MLRNWLAIVSSWLLPGSTNRTEKGYAEKGHGTATSCYKSAPRYCSEGGKPQKDEKGDNDKSESAKPEPVKPEQTAVGNNTATSNVINKFVKPSQPKNEKRDKTNNLNEKTK